MKRVKTSEQCYIPIDNNMYINVDLSAIKLYFILLFKAKPFIYFDRKTRYILLNRLKILVRAFRVLQFAYTFYKAKRNHKVFIRTQ